MIYIFVGRRIFQAKQIEMVEVKNNLFQIIATESDRSVTALTGLIDESYGFTILEYISKSASFNRIIDFEKVIESVNKKKAVTR